MARVLIIDSDAEIASDWSAWLSRDHEAEVVFDGRDAIPSLLERRWDVVLADPNAVGLDGSELLGQLERLEPSPELVLVSGPEAVSQAALSLRAVAYEFVCKPVDAARLRKVVGDAVQWRGLRDEKRRIDRHNRRHREQLEAMLQERTLQIRQVFSNAPGVLYRIAVMGDGSRQYTFVSESAPRVLELGEDDFKRDAQVFDALVHPEDTSRYSDARRLAESRLEPFRFEGRFVLPSGRIRWLSCVANPMRHGVDCMVWDGIVTDVTERNEVESSLHLADRLAAVGNLAASVAHQVNNPLSYAIANLGALKDQLRLSDSDTQTKELLAEIGDGLERIKRAMVDLTTFSKPSGELPRQVSVARVLDASIRLASNEIRHRATLIKDYRANAELTVDESSLGQAFLNLLICVARSIPEGDANRHGMTVSLYALGEAICVEISGDGSGISFAELARAFDPFTEVGSGSLTVLGAGLRVSNRIITGMGGSLSVKRAEGDGSLFEVCLPVPSKSCLQSLATT